MPRIIAGELGGRPIPGSAGKGTRPTTDRVREALFSRLAGWDAIDGARVLDLYAGTGALAFEALSRGARSALLVEAHGASAQQLRRSAKALGLEDRTEVRAARAETVVDDLPAARVDSDDVPYGRAGTDAGAGWDLVFIDPPYEVATEAVESLLVTLLPALAPEAVVVVERSSRTRPISWPGGYADDGTKSYGETALQYGGPA